MSVVTIEGVVENGQIRLRENVAVSEGAKVYVVIPDVGPAVKAQMRSPRLADPRQAADFAKHVIEVSDDAGL